MLFVEVVLKNLLRRKTRSLLTATGLAAAVATTTALLSIAWTYADSAADFYASRKVDIVVVRAGVAERITSSLSGDLGGRLAAVPEIAEVEGSLTEMVSLGKKVLVGIPLHGVAPGGFTIRDLAVGSGRTLQATDRRVVLLGSSLARALDKAPGDEIEVEGTAFRVVGLFQTGNALESNTAVAPLADVQSLMGRPGQVSEFQLRIAPGALRASDVNGLCRRIEALGDEAGRSLGFKALPSRQFVDTDMETRLVASMAWGTSVIAVLLSLVGMLNTMLMSVLERTKELGILRAIGWSRGRVLRLILGESLTVGLVAALMGAAGAIGIVRVLAVWSFTRNFVQPTLSPGAAALGLGLTLAAALAGSFYPAYRGATIAPVEALRFEG